MQELCNAHLSTWSIVWPELVKGLPAAIVALLVAVIAWRQYKVAKAKLNLDLFEHRYAVFEITRDYLSESIATEPSQISSRGKFTESIPRAKFLFGSEVASFMQQIHNASRGRGAAHHAIKTTPQLTEEWEDARRREAAYANELQHAWQELLHERFGPYMDFEKWKR